MKNVNEFRGFVNSGLNSVKEGLEDGKLNGDDFASFLDTFLKAPAAIEDFGQIGAEVSVATNAQMDESDKIPAAELGAFSAEDRRDIARVENAVWAALRYFKRREDAAREEGKKAGRAALVAELKTGKVKITDL